MGTRHLDQYFLGYRAFGPDLGYRAFVHHRPAFVAPVLALLGQQEPPGLRLGVGDGLGGDLAYPELRLLELPRRRFAGHFAELGREPGL